MTKREKLRIKKRITDEDLEKRWIRILRNWECEKCGSNNLSLEGLARDSLLCKTCGHIVYKQFCIRTSDWEICPICNSYYILQDDVKFPIAACSKCLSEMEFDYDNHGNIVFVKKIVNVCAYCGKIFETTHASTKFCKHECREAHEAKYQLDYRERVKAEKRAKIIKTSRNKNIVSQSQV